MRGVQTPDLIVARLFALTQRPHGRPGEVEHRSTLDYTMKWNENQAKTRRDAKRDRSTPLKHDVPDLISNSAGCCVARHNNPNFSQGKARKETFMVLCSAKNRLEARSLWLQNPRLYLSTINFLSDDVKRSQREELYGSNRSACGSTREQKIFLSSEVLAYIGKHTI